MARNKGDAVVPQNGQKDDFPTAAFDKICRACMTVGEVFNIFELTYESITLSEIFRSHVTVTLEEGDQLPQNVCKTCMAVLAQMHVFVQQCARSDAILRTALKEHNNASTTYKQEKNVDLEYVDVKPLSREEEIENKNVIFEPLLNECNVADRKPNNILEIADQNVLNLQTTVNVQDDNSSDESKLKIELQLDGRRLLFPCRRCKEAFCTYSELKLHHKQVSHPRPRKFECSECSKAVTTYRNLELHMQTHAKAKLKKFSNIVQSEAATIPETIVNDDLVELLREALQNNNRCITLYSCKRCNMFFGSKSKLKMHQKVAKHPILRKLGTAECDTETLNQKFKQDTAEAFENSLNTNLDPSGLDDSKNIVKSDCVENGNALILPKKYSLQKCITPSDFLLNAEILPLTENYQNVQNDDIVQFLNTLLPPDKSHLALYICKPCNKFFATQKEYRLHRKQVKHSRLPKYVTCPVCFKVCSNPNRLTKHMVTHTKEKPFCCEICQTRFSVKPNLRRHMMIHTGERPYKCEFCNKGFIQSGSLADHRRQHTGETPFLCNYCGKRFKQQNNYFRHIKSHPEENDKTDSKPLCINKQCQICSQQFPTVSSLRHHMAIHGPKSFLCNYCGKSFLRRSTLSTHMHIHKNIKRFRCKVCSKTFPVLGQFKSHMRTHTGETPYSCKMCQKTFKHRSQLRYHLFTHNGEKNFKCSHCDKAFAVRGSLNVHLQIHTGVRRYICDVCGKGFYYSCTFKKHKRLHEKLNKKVAQPSI